MSRRIAISLEGWAALLFALARTGVCAYRAATQSVVHDEALTYVGYVSGPWSNVYAPYFSNNHILFTILSRLSIRVLGLSEFSFRLASIIAGFLLILGIYRVLQQAAISVPIRWAALLAVGLHPLLLDFSVAARGYSLALACLIWALVFSMRGRDVAAGLLLGLGLSANLVVAHLALGLLLSRFALSGEAIPKSAKGAARTTNVTSNSFAPHSVLRVLLGRLRALLSAGACMVLVFVAICWGVVRSMVPANFATVGLPSLQSSLDSVVMTSIRATVNHGLFGTIEAARFIEDVMIPAVMILVAFAGILMWRAGELGHTRFLPAATLGLACAGMVAGHYLVHLNYPTDRTGLPFVVLAGIAWAIAVGEFKNSWVTCINMVLATALLVQFLTQFDTSAFQIWRYDRSTKQIVQRLAEECSGREPGSVRVSATWFQQPALEFYRIYKKVAALQPVERIDRTRLSGFDYYVLNAPDTATPEVRQMEVLFSDPLAGVILARERR